MTPHHPGAMILTNLLLYLSEIFLVNFSFSGPVVIEKEILKVFSLYKHM
jgi:hypothetical protein